MPKPDEKFMKKPANRCGSGSDRGLVCVDPCASCRTHRTCVNSSGGSKAASGQSTHIKWADSTAHEPQACCSVHSRVCLLARISIRANGLMENTEQASDPSSDSLVQVQNAGDSQVSKCLEMDNRGGENLSTQPSLLSFVVNEVQLAYPPGCVSHFIHFQGLYLTPETFSFSLSSFLTVIRNFPLHKGGDVTT